MAYELQAAKTKQKLREEEMQILVVERQQQILVQEQEILRKEKELDAKVRRPADAEKYQMEVLAEAQRQKAILAAQAAAEALRLKLVNNTNGTNDQPANSYRPFAGVRQKHSP